MMEQRSDIELIEGAIARNHEAFENLVTRYYRSVYGRIARHTLPWVDRDDIVQETFIAAYEKLAQLKEKERFEAWLCRIADNVLRKWHRRQIVQVEFDEACLDTAGAPVVSRATESGDLMIAHLRTALKRLSVQHRQMLLHHYVQQRSYADIGLLMNCTVDTVRSRLQKARNILRKEITHMTKNGNKENIIELDRQGLAGLRTGALVRSRDPSRVPVTGVLLETAGTLCAADGRHLILRACSGIRKLTDSVILGNCEASDFPDMEQARLIVGITEASLQIDGRETRVFPIIEAEYPRYRQVFPQTWHYSIRLTAETVSGLIAEVEPYLEGRHPPQDGWSYYPLAEFSLNVTAQELSVRVGKVMGYSGEGKSIDLLMPDVPHWEHTTTVKGPTKQQLSENNDSVVFHMNFTFFTNAIAGLWHSPSDCIEFQIVDSISPVVFRSSSQCDDISVVMPYRPD
jgi:RNA polymerase sigma-70 factor, ECF subfamily